MLRSITMATMITTLAVTPTACAQDVNTQDKEAIETVVKDYLLENPEIIIEALNVLDERIKQEAEETAKIALAQNRDALYNNPNDYSIGPDDAEVTIVEFFDYKCPPCKASAQWVNAAPANYDGKVRVVFKEFPILSAESVQASYAALAAGKQGKYVEMHRALMSDRSKLADADIDRIAESVGVDVEKMREDMKSEAIEQAIEDNRSLAQKIQAGSTPTFIVNDTLHVGGVSASAYPGSVEAMEKLIKESS